MRVGRTLLSSHWSSAYALPEVQAGPLQLLLDGSVGRSAVALALVQAVVAVGADVAVARVLRHSPHALWAAPLAVLVARLLLDPLRYQYYLVGPQGLIFVGAVLGAARWTRLRSLSRESFA